MKHFPAFDLTLVKPYSLRDRRSKIDTSVFARPPKSGMTFAEFFDSLPVTGLGSDLRCVVAAIREAVLNRRTVIFGMGAHVVKVGLSPVVNELLRRGIITGVAMNGAGLVHDLEIALVGHTSENVDEALARGSFGMAHETAECLRCALALARREGLGLGQATGEFLRQIDAPYRGLSILNQAVESGIPATVHVAIGTDIVHMHPGISGADLGEASLLDFRIFTALVADLSGGVYLNVGSSVILPEVFLKALALTRNVGVAPEGFVTVNLDMVEHYRPSTNVVRRPTLVGGRGYTLLGRHELLIPLLACALIESVKGGGGHEP